MGKGRYDTMTRHARQHRFLVSMHLVDVIVQTVADYYGIGVEALRGTDRRRTVARARFVAMFTVRRASSLSYDEIDRLFKKTHGAALYAVDTVETWLLRDPRLKDDLLAIARVIVDRTQPGLLASEREGQRLLAEGTSNTKRLSTITSK